MGKRDLERSRVVCDVVVETKKCHAYLSTTCILNYKVFIQASGLACEVYVEVSLLCSLPIMVCEIKVCLISVILCY